MGGSSVDAGTSLLVDMSLDTVVSELTGVPMLGRVSVELESDDGRSVLGLRVSLAETVTVTVFVAIGSHFKLWPR